MTLEAAPPSSLDTILRRDRMFMLAAIVAITAISWGYMFFDAWRMNHGMSCCQMLAQPQANAWPIADLVMMFVMWSVMMVAMMTPSAAPMVLTFAALSRKRREEHRPFVPTGIFLLGYLAVWTAFSAAVTLVQWRLHAAALLSPEMVGTSPHFGGALLIAAGIFQFTPMKHACLMHCRTPMQFLITGWREGPAGAFTMGLEHGLRCTICCWLLMVLLFVLGVMNLLWVATITIFVLIEKMAPGEKWITRIGGATCIVWGLALILKSV